MVIPSNQPVYMIAECDLSFATVQKKSFRELVYVLNEDATPLINTINEDLIATHITRMYNQSEETIKTSYIGKQVSISFTQATKLGITALGSIDDDDDGNEISMATVDAGSNDESNLITQTINSRFTALNSCQPELHAKKIRGFEINVSTRWNSTFLMFQRALLLEKSYTHFCQQNQDVAGFNLLPAEWNQARIIMKFLEPLSEATELLCVSKYPTLNNALPVYIVLIQHLDFAHQGLHKCQLIQPADQMIKKINQYLNNALQKPVYICAMILDPQLKL
ncbi:hypothetical protein MJO29_007743 [Puccinia striiformis f. sp. tritici]|nr:hypothetical protein MJO29_007743 [Puccinia striiformis f. sp. tritici]KAI9613702.1 hypothetical protein KEM48_003701 [Puccinia striiformis f. sp. tritici PST-130]